MEKKKIFAREEHFCPYNKNATCSGWTCDSSCEIHPDYEDNYDYDLEDAYMQAYNNGWQQGYKKGYIAAMEDEDAWVEDEDEECNCPCGLDCCEFNDYNLDASDCEGCEFNVGGIDDLDWEDYTEEDDDIYEKLFQSGDLVPEVAKAYEKGKNYGFDKGLSEGSLVAEDNYILGYKDCLLGENPFVYNEELNELLEQNKAFENYDNSVPAGLDIDTDIIDSLEVLKNELIDLKRGYLDREDITEKQFINRVMSMLHTIGIIQENYVKEELFRYLGYK